MDRELWKLVLLSIRHADRAIPSRGRRPVYADWLIVALYVWSVWHDRPLCWACDRSHYGALFRPRKLPSVSQFCRRIKTRRCREILQHVHDRFAQRGLPIDEGYLDGKAMPVGRNTKDRDAKNGKLGGGLKGLARGYKLHAFVNEHRRIVVWSVTGLNVAEQKVAAELLDHLPPMMPDAVVMMDRNYDSAPLHQASEPREICLINKLKGQDQVRGNRRRRTKLQQMGRSRRDLVKVWEQTPQLVDWLLKSRDEIERAFGVLVCTGGGLAGLPAWVRTMDRVRRWVGVKIVLYNARLEVQETTAEQQAA
jgi:hypothetical protein